MGTHERWSLEQWAVARLTPYDHVSIADCASAWRRFMEASEELADADRVLASPEDFTREQIEAAALRAIEHSDNFGRKMYELACAVLDSLEDE